MTKMSEEERWPNRATWAKLKRILSPNDYARVEAIFRNRSTDSHALAAASQILYSTYRANGGYELILELVSTHSASRIIIIWIRSSPDEYIILEVNCISQRTRAYMGYECFESYSPDGSKLLDSPDGSVILFPIRVVAEGLSGYQTEESAKYARLRSHVKAVADAAPDKDVSVLATEFNRISRKPEVALRMTREVRALGAGMLFMKHGSSEKAIKEYAKHQSEYLAKLALIHEVATHIDPAKGLRAALSQPHKDLQAKIDRQSLDIQRNFGAPGTSDRRWLELAVSNGATLRTEGQHYDESAHLQLANSPQTKALATCLQRLLENPDAGAEEAAYFARKTRGLYIEYEKQNVNLIFNRNSGIDDREIITLGGMIVGANQVALGRSYLQEKKLSSNDSIDAVLSIKSRRESISLIGDIALVVELIMRKKLKSLTATYTNRYSSHKGWIDFLVCLCEDRGITFGMSSCASGISPRDVAQKEHDRCVDEKAAYEQFLEKTSSESVSARDRELANKRIV